MTAQCLTDEAELKGTGIDSGSTLLRWLLCTHMERVGDMARKPFATIKVVHLL